MHGYSSGGRALRQILATSFVVLLARWSLVGAQECNEIFEGRNFEVSESLLKIVNSDFQKIIDCVPPGGKLTIADSLVIRPTKPVILNDKIHITSRRKGGKRPTLACGNEGEPLLTVGAPGVEIENLVISECLVQSDREAAVIVDIPPQEDDEPFQLKTVDFIGNRNENGTGSIYVASSKRISLSKVTFLRNSGVFGGGIYLDSEGVAINIDDCLFEENRAVHSEEIFENRQGRGGGLYQNASAVLTITGSRFLNNAADNSGGALLIIGDPPANPTMIIDTEFRNNTAVLLDLAKQNVDRDGGAIWAKGPSLNLTLDSCKFIENRAVGQGGGLFLITSLRSGEMFADVRRTIFKRNSALFGGGIRALASSQWRLQVNVSDSIFTQNKGLLEGVGPGEVFSNARDFPFVDPGNGAAIMAVGHSLEFASRRNVFENNTVIGLGGPGQQGAQAGAVQFTDLPVLIVEDTTFIGNEAINLEGFGLPAKGGAAHITSDGIQVARVKTSIFGSLCSRQCDPDATTLTALGITGPIDGCGTLDSVIGTVCILKNPTACDGEIENGTLITFKERGEIGAKCSIADVKSDVSVVNTTFIENTAHGDGGALVVEGTGANIVMQEGVKILRNWGWNGGGIFFADKPSMNAKGVIFEGNIANVDGGGIKTQGGGANIVISDGYFKKNEAKNGSGGAIATASASSNIIMNGTTKFAGNKAKLSGGAIHVISEEANIFGKNTTFMSNEAGLAGGAFSAKSARGDVKLQFEDVSFEGNSIMALDGFPLVGKGGGLSIEGQAVSLNLTGESNHFYNNSAREGGAIRIVDPRNAVVMNTNITGNTALSGGGLHSSFPSKSVDALVDLTNVYFIKNDAYMGGGMMVDARRANLSFVPEETFSETVFEHPNLILTFQVSLKDVYFQNQRAVKHGGGLFLLDAAVIAEDCNFTGNVVSDGFNGDGGAISLREFAVFNVTRGRFSKNKAVNGGAMSVFNSFFWGSNLTGVENTASSNGGFASLRGTARLRRKLLDLHDSSIANNSAATGGAIFANLAENVVVEICGNRSDDEADLFEEGFEKVDSVVAESCNRQDISSRDDQEIIVFLEDVSIFGNTASKAGGGVFTSDPSVVCACCSSVCSQTCNVLGLDGSLQLEDTCANEWVENSHKDGGYGPKVASFEASAEVVQEGSRIVEPGEFLETDHNSGEPLKALRVNMKDAFNQLVTSTRPNVFTRITSETTGGEILSGQVDTLVKEGFADLNATIVSAVPDDYELRISFPGLTLEDIKFNLTIRNCERGENPVGGQFSSSFRCAKCAVDAYTFSPNVSCRTCPNNAICRGNSLTPVDGYWHSSSWSNSVHKCLVDLACSFENRTVILQQESSTSTEAVSFEDYSLCREGYSGPLCGSCANGYGRVRAFECQKCLPKTKAVVLMVVMVGWVALIVMFLIRNAIRAGTPGNGSMQLPDRAMESAALSERRDSESTTVSHQPGSATHHAQPVIYLGMNPATENAKILINFLQVTSIALVINVNWREEVRRTLQIGDIISGFSANGGLLSLDCPLGEDTTAPVSIRRTIMAAFLPFGLLIIPLLFYVKGRKEKEKAAQHKRYALISLMVVAYVFYTGMTKRALRILHGVSVDDDEDDDDGDFDRSAVLLAVGRYWADDTSLLYFQGDHAYLTLFLGLPILVLYSIGFPLGMFYTLRGNMHRLNDEQFARTFGFLYRAYQNKYSYWEILVMARKALMVGVVVFVYELGGNLQAVFAVMVLMAALVLHLISQPYREELSQMNHRETLSLCLSVYTYLVGIAFNDDRLPEWSKVTLSVILLVCIIALTVYLVISLMVESIRHLDTVLETRGLDAPTDANALSKVCILVNYYWFRIMNRFWELTEGGLRLAGKGNVREPKPGEP